ncbi:hypothetical protein J7I91_23770, partial [Pseudomonas sp. ISL-84]|nr:hypothetical protein [Pseudomonas sp. ISL-84]
MAEAFLYIQAMSSLITQTNLIALAVTEQDFIPNGIVFLRLRLCCAYCLFRASAEWMRKSTPKNKGSTSNV